MAPVIQGIQFLERLGFADIVLWLLSFALVYGILTQIKMPQSNIARAIIGIVAAFFVLLSVPTQLISVLSSMSTGLVLLVVGILVFLIFLELAGVKLGKYEYEGVKETKGTGLHHETKTGMPVFKKHTQAFAALLIVFAILIFVAAGGLNLLGFNISLNSSTAMTLLILGVIVLAVYWLITERQSE